MTVAVTMVVVVMVVVRTAMRLVEPRVAADGHHVGVGRPDPDLVDGEGARRVETDPRHETEIQVDAFVSFLAVTLAPGITAPF